MLTKSVIQFYREHCGDDDLVRYCELTSCSMDLMDVLLHRELQEKVNSCGFNKIRTQEDLQAFYANCDVVHAPSKHMDIASMLRAKQSRDIGVVAPQTLPRDIDAPKTPQRDVPVGRHHMSYRYVVSIAERDGVNAALSYAVKHCPFNTVQGFVRRNAKHPEILAAITDGAAAAKDPVTKRYLHLFIDGTVDRSIMNVADVTALREISR